MLVYVTKYALTRGILEIEVKECKTSTDMVEGVEEWKWTYFNSGEWFSIRAEAVARAYEMRGAKLVSLRKQLDCISKLKFE